MSEDEHFRNAVIYGTSHPEMYMTPEQAEIERLRAENEKLLRRIHLFKNTRNEKVFEKLIEARAENAKLRAALKPFDWSSFPVDWEKQPNDTMFTLHISGGHLRAAAAALKETE